MLPLTRSVYALEMMLINTDVPKINSMSTSDGEGPAWNKFWMSLDNETESVMSGEGSRLPITSDGRSLASPHPDVRHSLTDRGDSVLPNDSASHAGAESPEPSAIVGAQIETTPFPFKFKAPSGRMHRLQVIASSGISDLVSQVSQKLGSEADAIGSCPEVVDGKVGKTGFALSYLDNEGDTVSIMTDEDLLEAITLANRAKREKVDLFVHDPEKSPIPATVNPQPDLPVPSSEASMLRQRKHADDEDEIADDEENEMLSRHRQHLYPPQQQEQIIQGVPNDLLLPGAIVTLAVVIAGVFTISRITSNSR